jgi:hypothetical protein
MMCYWSRATEPAKVTLWKKSQFTTLNIQIASAQTMACLFQQEICTSVGIIEAAADLLKKTSEDHQ